MWQICSGIMAESLLLGLLLGSLQFLLLLAGVRNLQVNEGIALNNRREMALSLFRTVFTLVVGFFAVTQCGLLPLGVGLGLIISFGVLRVVMLYRLRAKEDKAQC